MLPLMVASRDAAAVGWRRSWQLALVPARPLDGIACQAMLLPQGLLPWFVQGHRQPGRKDWHREHWLPAVLFSSCHDWFRHLRVALNVLFCYVLTLAVMC